MASFAEMAKMNEADLPEVKLLPMGTYIAEVSKLPVSTPSKSGAGSNVRYNLSIISPAEEGGPDEDDLAAFGSVKGVVRTLGFYYPEQETDKIDADMLARMQASSLEDHNKWLRDTLKVEGSSISERMANCLRHQLLVDITHKPHYQIPNKMVDDIARTAPLPD